MLASGWAGQLSNRRMALAPSSGLSADSEHEVRMLEPVQKQSRVNPGISLAHVGCIDVAHVNVFEESGSLGLSN